MLACDRGKGVHRLCPPTIFTGDSDNMTTAADMKSAGFIGLGWMGNPMAQNLVRAGFDLTVFDINPDAMARIHESGAKFANCVADLATCDIVFLMVNTQQQIREVIFDQQGLLSGLSSGQRLLIVVLSTVSPLFMRELADELSETQVTLLDAPVSGGPVLAQRAQLSIMFGGAVAQLERLRPWFQVMARDIFHAGELGSGMAVKLLNNIVALNNSAVFLEVLDIGAQWGLPADTIKDVLQLSSGRNWGTDNWEVFKQFMRLAVIDDPRMVDTAIKDIALASEWAEHAGIDVAHLPHVAAIVQNAFKVSATLMQTLWPDCIAKSND